MSELLDKIKKAIYTAYQDGHSEIPYISPEKHSLYVFDDVDLDEIEAEVAKLTEEVERLREVAEKTAMLRDMSFLDGLKAGWNVGVHEDQEEYDRIYNSMRSQISFAKKDKENQNG